jgi:hypothetical protein
MARCDKIGYGEEEERGEEGKRGRAERIYTIG